MKEVHVSLYREHLEEASFLYQQRLYLLGDPEMPWTALHDFEQRLEAHIDALVVGGELALSVCQAQADEGDAGELFAAICVFCRQQRPTLLAEALKHGKAAEPERAQALADALKHELPTTWHANCLRTLEQRTDALLSAMATVVGYRRIPSQGLLSRKLAEANAPAYASLLWAMGRTREPQAAAAIRSQIAHGSLPGAPDALHAMLRLHDYDAMSDLRRQPSAPISARAAQWVSMGVGRPCTSALLAQLKNNSSPSRDVIQALGLLGDLAAVRPLLRNLVVEELAADTAEALYVITGAALFEEVFIPEPVEEDELLESEALQYKQTGQPLPRSDGQIPGSKVRRLSRDPTTWEDWITTNAARFTAHMRFRCGQPASPGVLLQCLASNDYPKAYRGFLVEELWVGYAIDLPFETDMLVQQQQRIMQQAAPDVMAASGRFEPGHWYVAGQLAESS